MRTLVISCALILVSCEPNNILMSSASATINVNKLHRLQVGMSQEDVYDIMRYPMKEDQITTADGCYDIWFYLTKSTILGQSKEVPRNLTPLVFKDGIFVGMGYDYYNWLVRKTKTLSKPEIPSPAEKEHENIELEKTLAPPASKKLSMNSKLKQPPTSEKPAPQKKEEEEPVKMDDEDRDLLDEEQEEHFDEW